MSPGIRKLALSLHLVVSVGWIGAVIAYLALDVAGVQSTDPDVVKASFIAMDVAARWVIVPLALATLVTGLIMALGTQWGLFRHYWVLISFALTLVANVVLIEHVTDIRAMAAEARQPMDAQHAGGSHAPGAPRATIASGDFVHAGGGLVVLLVVNVLNIYKPRGLTPYGWRKLTEARKASIRDTQRAS